MPDLLVETPEGLTLRYELAGAGSRSAAALIDLALWGAAMLFAALVLTLLGGAGGLVLWVVTGMLLSLSAYQILFASFWGGLTPGKWLVGLRTIDEEGFPATILQHVLRGLFWPLEAVILIVPVPFGVILMASTPRRQRLGDMVAGTVVVLSPRAALRTDLGGREVERSVKKAAQFTFSKKQLEVYGIYELQVLEELLRRQDPYKREAVHAVCQRIQRRIQWRGDPVRTERFLREFYTAVRAHLEQRMLLGKRKKDKHS